MGMGYKCECKQTPPVEVRRGQKRKRVNMMLDIWTRQKGAETSPLRNAKNTCLKSLKKKKGG